MIILKPDIKIILFRFVAFAKVGAFVTLLSLALNYLFLKIWETALIPTYILIYLSMISLSFLLNSKYTFKAKRSAKRLMFYYGSYGSSMLLGVLILSIFKALLPFENWILSYMVIPFTMASNFILSSIIFKEND